MRKPIAIDVFSGAGGLSLGLSKAGFDVRLAVELDKYAAATYRKNLGDHVLEQDIRKVTAKKLLKLCSLRVGECDLLAGGPPCQGFSIQRRGSDQDPRNEFVMEFLRLVEGVVPRFFLMENVAGLMSKRGKPFINKFIQRATEAGYSVQIETVDAVKFGVPQFRRRVILIGEFGVAGKPRFSFPHPSISEMNYRTVRDAIGNLPSPPKDGSPHPHIANHMREAKLSALNIERIRHIPEGGGREFLPVHLQLACHRNNPTHRHVDVYGRLAWDKPAGTITARFDSFTRGRFGHPVEDRSLTPREGARLQTFTDNFEFVGNREEVAKQVGNAVPPLLGKIVGQHILKALNAMPGRRSVRDSSVRESARLG